MGCYSLEGLEVFAGLEGGDLLDLDPGEVPPSRDLLVIQQGCAGSGPILEFHAVHPGDVALTLELVGVEEEEVGGESAGLGPDKLLVAVIITGTPEGLASAPPISPAIVVTAGVQVDPKQADGRVERGRTMAHRGAAWTVDVAELLGRHGVLLLEGLQVELVVQGVHELDEFPILVVVKDRGVAQEYDQSVDLRD